MKRMPTELRHLSIWLRERGVEEVVMESTAQYWRSVWMELEPYMSLHLAQAFSNRAPRGRKHDFKDAERLARRFLAKELIMSFVPGKEQRIWRNLTRMRLAGFVERADSHDPSARHHPDEAWQTQAAKKEAQIGR